MDLLMRTKDNIDLQQESGNGKWRAKMIALYSEYLRFMGIRLLHALCYFPQPNHLLLSKTLIVINIFNYFALKQSDIVLYSEASPVE